MRAAYEEDSHDRLQVVITITFDDNSSSFSFDASRSQAALYVYLSGNIRILQCESLGSVKHVQELLGFFSACRNAPILEAQLKKYNTGKVEVLSLDDFMPIAIKAFVDSSCRYTVSVTGAELKNSKSIPVEEVLSCLHFYKELQTSAVGFYRAYAKNLEATQIDNLYRLFSGEVGGYFTQNRSLQKLFWTNHGVDGDDALFSPFKRSVLAAIDKRKCLIDPHKVVLSVVKNDQLVDFALQVGNDKVDLKAHATVKRNEKTGREKCYLNVISVMINRIHEIPCHVEYVFPSQDRVSPAINAAAMKFLPGFVAVRLVKGRLQVEIPVTEHLDQSTCKSDQG